MAVSGLPQFEATKAYMPKDPDELSLKQAELVIVFQKEEGEALVHTAPLASPAPSSLSRGLKCPVLLAEWCYGERMRDGERGWFPASCATEITDPNTIENNVQRMKRLRKETNV